MSKLYIHYKKINKEVINDKALSNILNHFGFR